MDTETWMPITFNPRFEVSSFGRVRSLYMPGMRNTLRQEPRVKVLDIGKDGTVRAAIRSRSRLVSRLVLTAFVGPAPKGHEASHKDGDQKNNRLDNLCWETHSQNEARKMQHGTFRVGEKHPCAKLTNELVLHFRQRVANGERVQDLHKETKVSYAAFYNAMKGHTWKHADNPAVNRNL